jgi:hypothetical protein
MQHKPYVYYIAEVKFVNLKKVVSLDKILLGDNIELEWMVDYELEFF